MLTAFYICICLMFQSQNDINVAINISGKQRMISQKLTKEFLLLMISPNDIKRFKQFNNTVNLFKYQLEDLKNGNPRLNIPKAMSQEII